MKIAIIGGGIGGLATAAILSDGGYDVTVFERSGAIEEIGAGIALFSNGVKALTAICGENPLPDNIFIKEFTIATSQGKELAHMPMDEITVHTGFPSYILARSELQKILLKHVPKECIETASPVEKIAPPFNKPQVIFSNDSKKNSRAFDIVIGADGVKSVVRHSLHGNLKFRNSGEHCCRAIIPFSVADPSINREVYGKNGDRFGIHPISKDTLYFWATLKDKPKKPDQDTFTVSELKSCFANWAFQIPEIIQSCPENALIYNKIYDLKPLKCWGNSHTTLLGDAAHPSTPNLGQGGSMALEDAVILRQCLDASKDNPAQALKNYEQKRIPRASSLVQKAWLFGKIASTSSPLLQKIRNFTYRSTPKKTWCGLLKQQYTFDIK